jgi:hypothetical protein
MHTVVLAIINYQAELHENIKSKTNDIKLHGLRGIRTISFEYPHQCQNDWILVKMKEFKHII